MKSRINPRLDSWDLALGDLDEVSSSEETGITSCFHFVIDFTKRLERTEVLCTRAEYGQLPRASICWLLLPSES